MKEKGRGRWSEFTPDLRGRVLTSVYRAVEVHNLGSCAIEIVEATLSWRLSDSYLSGLRSTAPPGARASHPRALPLLGPAGQAANAGDVARVHARLNREHVDEVFPGQPMGQGMGVCIYADATFTVRAVMFATEVTWSVRDVFGEFDAAQVS